MVSETFSLPSTARRAWCGRRWACGPIPPNAPLPLERGRRSPAIMSNPGKWGMLLLLQSQELPTFARHAWQLLEQIEVMNDYLSPCCRMGRKTPAKPCDHKYSDSLYPTKMPCALPTRASGITRDPHRPLQILIPRRTDTLRERSSCMHALGILRERLQGHRET